MRNVTVKNSLSRLRDRNLANVVRTLYYEPKLTLAEVAERVQLKRATVSVLLHQLVESELVREEGRRQDTGGRHAREFEVNLDRFRAVGVDIHRRGVRVVLTDLGGHIRAEADEPLNPGTSPVDIATRLIRRLLDGADRPVVGIGVGVPGPVDVERGVVRMPPNFPSMENVPLRRILAERFGVPVMVDDDARTRALAEWMLGGHPPSENLAYISVGTGIGAGLVVQGNMFYGVHGIAGQIGHVTVDPEGPRCSCGNVGCLEAVVLPLLSEGRENLAVAARYLAIGLLTLANLIDPNIIVLGGEAVEAHPGLLDEVKAYIDRYAVFAPLTLARGNVKHAAAVGAAMMGVKRLLDHPATVIRGEEATAP